MLFKCLVGFILLLLLLLQLLQKLLLLRKREAEVRVIVLSNFVIIKFSHFVRGLFSIAMSAKKKFSRKNKFEFHELWTVGNIRILRKPVSKIESGRHCGNTCRCRGKGIKINTKWAIRPIQGNRVYFILEVITLKTPPTK